MMQLYRNSLLAGGRSLGTVRQRIGHIEHLRLQHPRLEQVTTADLEKYLADRRHTHGAEARKSMRSSYRSFFTWAHTNGHYPTNPAAALKPIRVPHKAPRVAHDDQIDIGLTDATLAETAMVLLGREACLRLNEITTLHMRHREHDVFRVTGKGERQRLVPINSELMHVILDLEDQLGGEGYYFPGRFGGHMHPTSVNKIITRRLGTNPHSLRHAGATAAFQNGGRNLRAVQELLGHASLATTQIYLHTSLDELREATNGTRMRRHLRLVENQDGGPPIRQAA